MAHAIRLVGWLKHVKFFFLFFLQVTLQDQVEVAGEDSEAITTFLEGKVERMIQKANSRAVGGRGPMLPLIRLRVAVAWKEEVCMERQGTEILRLSAIIKGAS